MGDSEDKRVVTASAVGAAAVLNLINFTVPSGRTLIVFRERLEAIVTATEVFVDASFEWRDPTPTSLRRMYRQAAGVTAVPPEEVGTEEVPVFKWHNDTNAAVVITLAAGVVVAAAAANTYSATIEYAIR